MERQSESNAQAGLPGAVEAPSPRMLTGVLALLLLLRLAATFTKGEYGWGLSFARDLTPALTGPLLLLLTAGVGWALLRPGDARFVGRLGVPGGWPWFLGAAVLGMLAAFPDQVRFVGDFVLRLGVVEERWFRTLFPQTLPADRLVNHVLPSRLGALLHIEPLLVMRGLGLVEAALLVVLAVRFARRVSSHTGVACVVAIVLCCGGYATLLTGYSKPTAQVALCVLAAGTLGVELVATGGAVLGFSLAVALGLALHRGGLPLLAVWAVGVWLAWRGGHGPRSRLWPLAIPLIVFVVEAPRLLHVIRSFDVGVNFLPAEVQQQGGALAAAFAPLRLLDAANAVLFHAPLAPLALGLLPALRRSVEARFLLALVLAFVPVLLFVYLPLGPFRDYDALGGAGAAFAVASAWVVGRALERVPRSAALEVGVALSAIVPFLIALLSLTDLDRGFARAERLLAGPPARSATHRASVLDWMGLRALNEDRYALARDAYRRLSLETPVPRALKLWGAAALIADSPHEAQGAFQRLVERVPGDPVGWFGLWMAASTAGDALTASRASERALQWGPESREMQDVVEFFEHYPRLYDVVRGVAGVRDSLPR